MHAGHELLQTADTYPCYRHPHAKNTKMMFNLTAILVQITSPDIRYGALIQYKRLLLIITNKGIGMMHIKQERSTRLQHLICPLECSNDIFLFKQIIDTITERYHRIHRFRNSPFPHILLHPTDTALAIQAMT